MKVSIFGIGYVGSVSAACLARDGNQVTMVDTEPGKVETIQSGSSPIQEPGLDELIGRGKRAGRLAATLDPVQAVLDSDLSLVCVGTPSRPNGSLETDAVMRAAEEISSALKRKRTFHPVVVRSTILPGTMEELVIPALEQHSGLRAGRDFGVAYYPEFLRESTAIADYDCPGAVVFGKFGTDDRSIGMLHRLCGSIRVEPIVVSIRVAEAVKYVNNSWHALKISFANEIGNICKASGVDSYDVMEVLCSDTRLNISPAYLRPGFAFGGPCLPKDLRAIRFAARRSDVATPILDAALRANELQLSRAFDLVAHAKSRRVGMVGLSFKSNTDDLRESPLVDLAERLSGKGFDLRIYDPNVRYSALTGANLSYIRSRLPHLSELLVDNVDELLRHGETIIIGKLGEMAEEVMSKLGSEQMVVDLVRTNSRQISSGNYHGICW